MKITKAQLRKLVREQVGGHDWDYRTDQTSWSDDPSFASVDYNRGYDDAYSGEPTDGPDATDDYQTGYRDGRRDAASERRSEEVHGI